MRSENERYPFDPAWKSQQGLPRGYQTKTGLLAVVPVLKPDDVILTEVVRRLHSAGRQVLQLECGHPAASGN